MWTQLLSISGLAFWVILIIVIIVETIILAVGDPESGPDPTSAWSVFIAMLALICAILFTDAFTGVRWLWFIIGLAVYLTAGVLWSFKKWYALLLDKRDKLRAQWEAGDKKKPWPEGVHIPTAAENKGLLIEWMALWPFSFTWWVLTWPRQAFTWIYARLSTVYDRLAASVFGTG